MSYIDDLFAEHGLSDLNTEPEQDLTEQENGSDVQDVKEEINAEEPRVSERRLRRQKEMREKRGGRFYTLFFPIAFVFMEMVVRVRCFGTLFGTGFMFSLLFSLAFGLFVSFICGLFKKRGKFVTF